MADVVALAPLTARAAGSDAAAELDKAELIVNATSVGFASDDLPLDPAVLHPEHLVADLVYHPLDTALLRAARDAGARTFDGLGMLVHQAALQQQLWLGHLPDVTRDARRRRGRTQPPRRVGRALAFRRC